MATSLVSTLPFLLLSFLRGHFAGFVVELPSCTEYVIASSNSTGVIKSLSLYQDQVILLYQMGSPDGALFLYRFLPTNPIHPEHPLASLGLKGDLPRILVHGQLEDVFPGIGHYTAQYDIVSLLYYTHTTALFFFKQPDSNETFFVAQQEKNPTPVTNGSIESFDNHTTPSQLLLHVNDIIKDSAYQTGSSPARYLNLHESTIHEGTFYHEDGQLKMGSVKMRHLTYDDKKQRMYLSKDPYPRKAPLSAYLHLSGAIALLHYDTIYILSGNKSGTVYYFRPLSFARMKDVQVVPFTVKKMNYARFFGCHNENQGPQPEALKEDLIVNSNVSEASFVIYSLILVGTMVILCTVFFSYSNDYDIKVKKIKKPRKKGKHKSESQTKKNGSKTSQVTRTSSLGADLTPVSSELEKKDRSGYRRCFCSPTPGTCRSASSLKVFNQNIQRTVDSKDTENSSIK